MVKISVIIPHLNQPEDLARCLASLHEQTGSFDLVEIIVVDNGSRVMPTEVCAVWPDVTLLQELEPGPGPARNLGVRHAVGEVFAFIDADCTAHPGWLSAITAAMARAGHRILGGDVRIPRGDHKTTMVEAYESIYAYRMKEYIAKQGFTGTGNLAVERDVMASVGPFGGLNIAEDRDWGRRATQKDFKTIYVEDMIIYHPARSGFRELTVKWDRQISHDHAELRSPMDTVKWLIKAGLLIVSPIVEIGRMLTSDRVSGLRERWLAFLCVIRIRLHRAWRMLTVLLAKDARAHSNAWNRD
ncbi:MAG: glycosyltransferase [Pseudomonadota bacterium]